MAASDQGFWAIDDIKTNDKYPIVNSDETLTIGLATLKPRRAQKASIPGPEEQTLPR